jgi:hypothetical protein
MMILQILEKLSEEFLNKLSTSAFAKIEKRQTNIK